MKIKITIIFLLSSLVFGDISNSALAHSIERLDKFNSEDSLSIKASSKSCLKKALPYFAIAAGGAVMFALDKDLNRLSQNKSLHGSTAEGFFKEIGHFGAPGPYAISVPLLVSHGILFKNKKSILAGGELVSGLLLANGVTLGVKKIFGRKRPYESSSPYRFFKGGSSFYSGHTITAFTFATIISQNYPRQNLSFIGIENEIPLVPILSFSIAGLVAVQRMYGNYHWASDVYFGAFAGYAVGLITVRIGRKIHLGNIGMLGVSNKSIYWAIDF